MNLVMNRLHVFTLSLAALCALAPVSQVATAQQDFDAPPVLAAEPAPVIDRFDVSVGADRSVGNPVHFLLQGTAGGRAMVNLPGARQHTLALDEQRPGLYVGTYVVEPGDQLDAAAVITARLRRGDQVATASVPGSSDLAASSFGASIRTGTIDRTTATTTATPAAPMRIAAQARRP